MKRQIYKYNFGIDNIRILENVEDKTVCFVSDVIHIDGDNKSIELSANYDEGDGSIEFYIIDGTKEIAVLPNSNKNIRNEKIFNGMQTRFTVDADKEVLIKRDGEIINITLEQAMSLNKDGITVSYTALESGVLNVASNEIRVKVIFRAYDNTINSPYINNISLKQLRRSLTWI